MKFGGLTNILRGASSGFGPESKVVQIQNTGTAIRGPKVNFNLNPRFRSQTPTFHLMGDIQPGQPNVLWEFDVRRVGYVLGYSIRSKNLSARLIYVSRKGTLVEGNNMNLVFYTIMYGLMPL